MRLDHALVGDLRAALRSGPILAFLALQVGAGIVFVLRRGPDTGWMVALIWLGMATLAFFAWWAGRHRLAHPEPDPVSVPRAKAGFALLAVAGMVTSTFGLTVTLGVVLFLMGVGGWLWAGWRAGGFGGLRARLTRDLRPLLPLLLLVGLPRLLAGGPFFLVGVLMALPSGIAQQLLYLAGLYGPLEAVMRHRATAAVSCALLFALVHVPIVLEANEGDLVAAFANAVLFQASVALIACLAYQRHRAVLPIGIAHALAIF